MDLPARVIGDRALVVGVDRLVEIGQRAGIVLLAREGRAAQREGIGALRIELEDGVGVMRRAGEVAVVEPQRAARLQQIGVPGKFQRAGDVVHRLLALALGGVGLGAQLVGRRPVLLQADGTVVSGDGLVDVAAFAPDAGDRGERRHVLGVATRRLLVVAERAVEIVRSLARLRAQHEGRGVRIELEGAVEVGQRLGLVARAQIELAAAAIGAGAVGAEADRLAVVLQRALCVTEIAPHRGAVDVRRGRARIELDRGVVIGERLAEIAARVPGVAAILVGGREIRRELDGVVEVADRVRNVAAVEIGEAAQAVGDAERLALEAAGLQKPGAGGDALVGLGLRLRRAVLQVARVCGRSERGLRARNEDRRKSCGAQQPRCCKLTH